MELNLEACGCGCLVLTGICSLPGGQREGFPLHGWTPARDRGLEQHGARPEGARCLRPGSCALQVSSAPAQPNGLGVLLLSSPIYSLSWKLFFL